MTKQKCGKCGKEYTTDEYFALKKIPRVPEDTNPREQHGYTSVCECGYVFHRDKWHLQDRFEVKTGDRVIKGTVSTIFLELDHSFKPTKHLWYETMVFPEGDVECYFCERYETQEEAQFGHSKVLKALMSGKYKIKPHTWLLSIDVEVASPPK